MTPEKLAQLCLIIHLGFITRQNAKEIFEIIANGDNDSPIKVAHKNGWLLLDLKGINDYYQDINMA